MSTAQEVGEKELEQLVAWKWGLAARREEKAEQGLGVCERSRKASHVHSGWGGVHWEETPGG